MCTLEISNTPCVAGFIQASQGNGWIFRQFKMGNGKAFKENPAKEFPKILKILR